MELERRQAEKMEVENNKKNRMGFTDKKLCASSLQSN